jgi:hypothetical protein
MAVTTTSLVIKAAPLPSNFRGDPQAFFEAIVARMKIVAPFGFTSFIDGGAEPSSNEGPWFKDGSKCYVWSDDDAKYVPLDISDSLTPTYWVQETEPESGDPALWFKVNSTTFFGIYFFINNKWVPITPTSGSTANRPATPYEFQQYYDNEIETLIWWERGQWRTVSGTPGDIKHVSWPTSSEALTRNPGWEILGTDDSSNTAWRGRVISQATKDADGSPDARDLGVGSGITKRTPGTTFGSETHTLILEEIPSHHHIVTGYGITTANETPKIIADDDRLTGNATQHNTSDTGGGDAHANIQPTVAFWCLRKK